MAKAKQVSQGDVIQNRVAIGLAKQQSLVAALLGGTSELNSAAEDDRHDSDADLFDGDGDDEGFGVGAVVPKDIKDGTFTRRVPTSDDKLLQQLIGKKAAKAHLAVQKSGAGTKVAGSKFQKALPKREIKEEEEDEEEEGRASAFRSKKRRLGVPAQAIGVAGDSRRIEQSGKEENGEQRASNEKLDISTDSKLTSQVETVSRPAKAKTGSYLDEILAARSGKGKRSKKHKMTTDVTP